MEAGEVAGELTVAGEPFCQLLGIAVRWKNPFVEECPVFVNTQARTSSALVCITGWQSAFCAHTRTYRTGTHTHTHLDLMHSHRHAE